MADGCRRVSALIGNSRASELGRKYGRRLRGFQHVPGAFLNCVMASSLSAAYTSNADGDDAANRAIYIKTHKLRDPQTVAVLQGVHGGDRFQTISKAAGAEAARAYSLCLPDSHTHEIVSHPLAEAMQAAEACTTCTHA